MIWINLVPVLKFAGAVLGGVGSGVLTLLNGISLGLTGTVHL